jgi:AraC-like DNA-binding protein
MRLDTLSLTLPDMSARIMRDALADHRVNWNKFCARYDLKRLRLDEGSTVLFAREELLLQQGFVEATAEQSGLWLDVGLRYRSVSYATFGLAMMTAPTLGEALDTAARYQALSYSLITYSGSPSKSGAWTLVGKATEVPVALRQFSQHRDLGALRTLISDLTGGDLPVERVSVAASEPPGWEVRRAQFPFRVDFNAPQTQWVFRPGAAGMILPLSDKILWGHYKARCDRRLRRIKSRTLISERLSSILTAAPGRYSSAAEAAESLGLSERTLHRRLAEEGTRFSKLLDDARFKRSCQLLTDRSRSIEDVAFEVGFAEPSSFSRAFRRWCGMGSTEYRRRLGGADPAPDLKALMANAGQ